MIFWHPTALGRTTVSGVELPGSAAALRRSGIGASRPLPCVPTKIPSPFRLQTSINANRVKFTACALASRLRASWMEARVTKVARVSARFSKSLARRRFWPNQEKGALDHPAARQDDEALHVVAALDDLHAQNGHFGHGRFDLPGVVAAIGPDQFEPGEAPSYLVEHQPGAVAILDCGRVDDHPHRQSLGIDQGMDLAAFHLLAGVVTHLVVFTAPFSADFSDWLSRTAADGLASRPIRSRSAICSSAQIASQVPARWNLRKRL